MAGGHQGRSDGVSTPFDLGDAHQSCTMCAMASRAPSRARAKISPAVVCRLFQIDTHKRHRRGQCPDVQAAQNALMCTSDQADGTV